MHVYLTIKNMYDNADEIQTILEEAAFNERGVKEDARHGGARTTRGRHEDDTRMRDTRTTQGRQEDKARHDDTGWEGESQGGSRRGYACPAAESPADLSARWRFNTPRRGSILRRALMQVGRAARGKDVPARIRKRHSPP